MEQLLSDLQKLAGKTARCDNEDFNAYDWSGGNIDDAYEMGYDDGEILLARKVLQVLQG